jgi:YHS domain-containing protein
MKRLVSGFLLVFIPACVASAQKADVFSTAEGAIRGYDAVEYFISGKALKGAKEFTVEYKGVSWYFVSMENRTRFVESPEKYAPQFGGYCAYAVSQNYTYETDPLAFTIVNDKLYLNYNEKTMLLWRAKNEEYIKAADSNWPAVLNE